MIKYWRLWSYALGRKEGRNDREANIIAGIRTIIFVSYMVTNAFIVSGVLRHWNDVPSEVSETKEERLCEPFGNISKN
jgi:hypothetical protein